MLKMKRTMAVLLAFVLFLSLCACGQNEAPMKEPDSQEVVNETEPAAPESELQSIAVFNLAAFPFGASDENIRYIIDSTDLPVKGYETKEETIDFGDDKYVHKMMYYVLSGDETAVQIQYKDVVLDTDLAGDLKIEFELGEGETNKLEAFYLYGVERNQLAGDQDIKDYLRENLSRLGIQENAKLQRWEKTNQLRANSKLDGINFVMGVYKDSGTVVIGLNNYKD